LINKTEYTFFSSRRRSSYRRVNVMKEEALKLMNCYEEKFLKRRIKL